MTIKASSLTVHNEQEFDLAIVGGGIYGAALLWEASLRNLQAVLIEKEDFCAATSANSLKTIHGGIRYLQSLNFPRTLESDREKKILRRIAPNLIVPLDCCVPSDGSLTKNPISFWGAATLFNVLIQLFSRKLTAEADRPSKIESFAKARLLYSSKILFADLREAADKSARKPYLVWQDAQVRNSESLAMCFIRAACEQGSVALNYTEAVSLEEADKEYKKISLRTAYGETSMLKARTVVDCTGSSNFIASQFKSHERPMVKYVKAVNLVLNREFSKYAFASESRNVRLEKGGMLFFSPWNSMTLAGTWYFDSSDSERADTLDAETLSSCLNDMCSALSAIGAKVSVDQLRSMLVDVQIGFLPGKADEPHPEKSLIEKLAITEFGTGCYRMQGTKYTTARADAVKMVDVMAEQNSSIGPSSSHFTLLSGAQTLDQQSIKKICQKHAFEEDKQKVLADLSIRYGDLLPQMVIESGAQASDLVWVSDTKQITYLELNYFASEPHTRTLVDLLFRRISRNIFMHLTEQELAVAADVMARKKAWSDSEISANVADVKNIQSNRECLRHKMQS